MTALVTVPFATIEDLGPLRTKHCSRSTTDGLLVPQQARTLEQTLVQFNLSAAESADVKTIIAAAAIGDLACVERVVRQYNNQFASFNNVKSAVSSILPDVSDGKMEVLPTTSYRMPIPGGRIVEVINLTFRQSGSSSVVGVPTHPAVASEAFQLITLTDGAMIIEPDKTHEARWLFKQMARTKTTSYTIPPPPPMFAA